MFKKYDKTCPDCVSRKVNIFVYGEWGESESIEKPGQIWNGFVSEEVATSTAPSSLSAQTLLPVSGISIHLHLLLCP